VRHGHRGQRPDKQRTCKLRPSFHVRLDASRSGEADRGDVQRHILWSAPAGPAPREARFHLFPQRRRLRAAPYVGNPAALHLEGWKHGPDLLMDADKSQARQVGVERELVEIDMASVQVERPADLLAQKLIAVVGIVSSLREFSVGLGVPQTA
jgi:hypothetical protein